MDDSSTLGRFLEQIDAADQAMRQHMAREWVHAASASLEQNEGTRLEDLLCLYDQLIELLEFEEVLLAEQPNVWGSARAAREDPKLVGLQLDRLRAQRAFWNEVRAAGSGPPAR